MANLIWTGILYFVTIGVVFITYRVFVMDRQQDAERKTLELITRSYGPNKAPPTAAVVAPAGGAIKGRAPPGPAGANRQTAARFPLKGQAKGQTRIARR